jgi:hypothetical protein
VFNGRVAIFLSNGAKNKTREKVAAAQVLFVGRGVLCRWFRDAVLFGRAKLETQAFNYALSNLILHGYDVFRRGVYAIAPEYVARGYV